MSTSEPTTEERLFEESPTFDFFQAVRLLERLAPTRARVGQGGPPANEVARFRAHLSLSFPASALYELAPGSATSPPLMTVTFMGLTGPSGILPRHYTEQLLRIERELKGPEKHALRAWLDLFNHRLVSLFYRAWEKYRFWIAYERGDCDRGEPDPFTRCLYSFVGLGTGGLQGRLRAASLDGLDGRERVLARVEDLGLLYYAGLLAQRRRSAVGLESFLSDYFELPVRVLQFQGQWLELEEANQSRLGLGEGNSELGTNLIVGERVWDVESKIRLRVGPLSYAQFAAFLPDRETVEKRKGLFLLMHLTRLYVGAERDYDVQLLLRAQDVPECQLSEGEEDGVGPRLGWNVWLTSQQAERPAEDAIFAGEEVVWVDEPAERGRI